MVFSQVARFPANNWNCQAAAAAHLPMQIHVALLTGGQDKPYAVGLAMALASEGVSLEIVGSDEVDSPELHAAPNITFLNFRGDQRRGASLSTKVLRVLKYYVRLIRYAAIAKPVIFHILWNNKVEYFDRTLLLLYYKFLGKQIVLTAHNVNAGRRDSNDSVLNRLTLRIQYRLADHIFVHTEKMRLELVHAFGARAGSITVLSYPINSVIPDTCLSPAEAKQSLGIDASDKTILFFGRICPYKGVEYLVAAFQRLLAKDSRYRLIIAGEPGSGAESYWAQIRMMIRDQKERIMSATHFIPDEETETYFKAADVLVLPYREIFQSGVLFLAYGFGLPVIATDVGSFREAIIDSKTGFICKADDPADLAETIEKYFESDLFETVTCCRDIIREYARTYHSSESAAVITAGVYAALSR